MSLISKFKKKLKTSDNDEKQTSPCEDKIEDNEKDTVSSLDKTVLFVCMSNKIVSPIAEIIFNQKAKNITAISAGISSYTGEKISQDVIDLFRGVGIDLSNFLTTNIDDISIEEMELILTSTTQVRDSLRKEFNYSNIFTIKEYSRGFDDLNINLSTVEGCFNEIKPAIDKIIERINEDIETNGEISLENYELTSDSNQFDSLVNDNEKDIPLEINPDLDEDVSYGDMDEDASYESIDEIEVEEESCIETDKLLTRNFNHLYNLVNSGEKNITLECNFVLDDDEFYEYMDGIEINVDRLVIDGNGCTIDANGLSRIFNISGKSITFKNIYFKNAFSKKKGGCIYCSESFLRFFNCDFISNTSKYEGGTIYNSESEITFDNCKFIENKAKWFGGTLSNFDGFLKFHDCEFRNNFSKKNACEIWNLGRIELYNSTFYNESCSPNKSLIFNNGVESSISILNSEITNELGKIIYLNQGSCIIESTNLKTSKTNDDYLLYNKTGNLKLIKLKLSTQLTYPIFNDGTVRIEENDEIANHIKLGNNGLIRTKPISSFDNNNFEYLSNLIESCAGELSLEEDISMFENEQAFFEGGIELCKDGLVINGNGHTINASNFSRIFLVTGKDITLKNIIFKKGRYWSKFFDTKKDGGGAITITRNASLNLIGCIFIGNNSRKSAGAILNNGKIQIKDCEFRNNGAKNHSGAILNKHYDLNVNHCKFIDNASGEDGSCIYNENGNLIVENESVFKDNKSDQYGGAIYIHGGDFELMASEFRNNKSKRGGGSVYIKNSDLFTIKSSIFENNHSYGKGGAIYNLGINKIDINENCIFRNNESANEGGALYLFDIHSKINIASASFNENKAVSGGVIFNLSSSSMIRSHLIIENCEFTDNLANVGGAITTGLYMECYSCHFEDNNTLEESGFISNGGKSHFKKCEFISNKSGQTIIYNIANTISSFKNCRISGNFKNLSINYGNISFEDNYFEKKYKLKNRDKGHARGEY